MKHLKKYNEGSEEPMMDHSYTWDELLYRIENDEIKLLNSEYKEDVLDQIKNLMKRMSRRNPDIGTSPIVDPNRIRDGIAEVIDYVLVFNTKNEPVALLDEYEMNNPFVFGGIVIVPGRDSITCYNTSTGELKRERIR